MAKMRTAKKVYYGPSTSYPEVGNVAINEAVDFFG